MILESEEESAAGCGETEAAGLRTVCTLVALEYLGLHALITCGAEAGDELEFLAELECETRADNEFEEICAVALIHDCTGAVVSTYLLLGNLKTEHCVHKEIESLIGNEGVTHEGGDAET